MRFQIFSKNKEFKILFSETVTLTMFFTDVDRGFEILKKQQQGKCQFEDAETNPTV